MPEASPAAKRRQPVAESTDYVRFIVLGGGRSGSSVLVQALDSSPCIACFGEVFNWLLPSIRFDVEGYDNFSARDRELRERDPVRFLYERIFAQHSEEIRAVGFKLHYGHVWGFTGLLERLMEDTGIRVLHLRRRNLLRMLVSWRMAEKTGIWLAQGTRRLTPANLLRVARHPLRAATWLGRYLRSPQAPAKFAQVRITLSEEECSGFFNQMRWDEAHFDNLFRQHPKLTVFYEDLVDRRQDVLDQAQSFLGVEPSPLTVTLRRQNPEPLRDLLENYDELYEAFRDSPYAAFFE